QPYQYWGSCFLLLGLIFGANNSFGQTVLRGQVRGIDQGSGYSFGVIAFLDKDSSLLEYTRTDRGGNFTLKDISSGEHLLLVTYPHYEPVYKTILVGEKGLLDLGIVYLHPQADSLQTVIVLPTSMPPKMKGDTLEYNTSNIKLRPNAVVEELLSRLPGLR